MEEGRVAERLLDEANKYVGSDATDTVDGMFHSQKVGQGHSKVKLISSVLCLSVFSISCLCSEFLFDKCNLALQQICQSTRFNWNVTRWQLA